MTPKRTIKPPGTWEQVESGILRRWNQDGTATYYIRYRVTRRGAEREFRKRVGGKLYLARRELAERKIALDAGTHRERYEDAKEPPPRFDVFADEYIRWAKRHKKSWERDVTSLKPLRTFFGVAHLDEIADFDVRRYVRKREAMRSKITGGPISAATINRELSCLSRLYKLAAERGKIPHSVNPVRGVPRGRENKERWIYLEPRQIAKLLEVCDQDFRPLVLAALSTGMRPGELLRLRWGDVDFANRLITVRQTKSGTPRQVPINDDLLSTLAKLHRRADGSHVFTYRKHANSKQKPWKDYRRRWRQAREAAGLGAEVRFYDLRHTAATYLMIAGVHPFVVQDILGHSTQDMVRRYSHVTPALKQQAVEALRWDKLVQFPVKRESAAGAEGDVTTDED
jgi:integrase